MNMFEMVVEDDVWMNLHSSACLIQVGLSSHVEYDAVKYEDDSRACGLVLLSK
jgi:hypothetical protein